jgi:arylsulfatase A-like enzyme
MSSMNRREFACSAMAASTVAMLGQQRRSSPKAKKPNVLFIMADEWRAQAFGYAGDPNAHTPTIDRFAAESVNFEQMISCLPVCCPARASMLTGQYPLTHGVYINDVELKPKGTTLGEAFQNAGYETGYVGKWHVYGSPDGKYGRREAYIPPPRHFGFKYWKVAECCHDYNHSFYYEGDDPTKKFWEGYDANAQTDDVCRYIRDYASKDKPYFMVLSWGPPHFPLATAPEEYRAKYKDRAITLRENVAPGLKAEAINDLRGYYAHIEALDDCFARVLETVAATGERENTIIVFTSDHGDMMRSQGLTTKLYPWEESARVPLLIRYPRKYGKTGKRTQALIGTPDLMPTLLGLSELPVPSTVQGTDFSQLSVTKRTVGPATTAFLHMPVPITTARNYGIAEYRAVRNARFTYARSIRGPWLLYDNQNDPYQTRNLSGRPEMGDVQVQLEVELNAWLKALGDKFLPADVYLERDNLTHYMEPYAPVTFTRSPWGDWQSTIPIRKLSVDGPLKNLYDNPQAEMILLREVPRMDEPGFHKLATSNSLREVQHARLPISQDTLNRVEESLAALPGNVQE